MSFEDSTTVLSLVSTHGNTRRMYKGMLVHSSIAAILRKRRRSLLRNPGARNNACKRVALETHLKAIC